MPSEDAMIFGPDEPKTGGPREEDALDQLRRQIADGVPMHSISLSSPRVEYVNPLTPLIELLQALPPGSKLNIEIGGQPK